MTEVERRYSEVRPEGWAGPGTKNFLCPDEEFSFLSFFVFVFVFLKAGNCDKNLRRDVQ